MSSTIHQPYLVVINVHNISLRKVYYITAQQCLRPAVIWLLLSPVGIDLKHKLIFSCCQPISQSTQCISIHSAKAYDLELLLFMGPITVMLM